MSADRTRVVIARVGAAHQKADWAFSLFHLPIKDGSIRLLLIGALVEGRKPPAHDEPFDNLMMVILRASIDTLRLHSTSIERLRPVLRGSTAVATSSSSSSAA